MSQHSFLTSLGLPLRLAMLQRAAKDEARKKAIVQAGERLVSLTGMGQQYKVLGFESRTPKGGAGETYQGAFPFGTAQKKEVA